MSKPNDAERAPVHAVFMRLGVGTRKNPICLAYHVDFRWVPVIEFCEDHVVWDDNQFDRSVPPNETFEIDGYDKFDLEMQVYVPAA